MASCDVFSPRRDPKTGKTIADSLFFVTRTNDCIDCIALLYQISCWCCEEFASTDLLAGLRFM